MRPRLLAALSIALLLPLASAGARTGSPIQGGPVPQATPLDSALDEMGVGRYWHAALILRGAGVHNGSDAQALLLLARAEAGWKNWPEVGRLLGGRSWLDSVDGGEGWHLLGRALEDGEKWSGAQDAYRAYLTAATVPSPETEAARVRLARVALAAGDVEASLQALDALPPARTVLRSWAALEAAEAIVESGDTARIQAFLRRMVDETALDVGWRVIPRARLAAGDTTGAVSDYLAAREGANEAREAEASTEAGRLVLAQGDSARARALLLRGLEGGSLRNRARASLPLLSFGDLSFPVVLRQADVLRRMGDNGPALRAYDRAARLAKDTGTSLSDEVRLARASLMALVGSRHEEALDEFRALREATDDPALGARNLESWAGLRRRQGRSAEVATLRRWLLEEYPGSSQAAEVLWDRGSTAQSQGRIEEALALYAALATNAPEHARAGEARMRTGQIRLGQGDVGGAGAVYERYLADFPQGRRWEEASYWAARARLAQGDTVAARQYVARIRREEPVSYYAVMGADLLDQPYDVPVPEGQPAETPPWLAQGLVRMDLLTLAGLSQGADAVERDLVERARGSAAVLLTVAEALNDRGRTVAGINLGWDLRREGAAWDRRLLQVVYPFPYREMVVREAKEWGVDPIMMAAIIRQESAFKADIRSHAGAVGLMQVMPPTGRELAQRHGPSGFREANLEAPEVNLHLGAIFFRDMSVRYDNDLPLVLSAYNAGPTRATRWKRYPEAADPLRFTERIPFDETRGYVKNVRRNLGLYQVLYGQD